MRPVYIWGVAAVLWAGFFGWYTNLGGPLTAEEIEYFAERMQVADREPEVRERLLKFLREDDGDDFLMMNVIQMHEKPERIEGVGPDETSQEVLGRYMEYMWPALLRRACHPVIAGGAVAPTLENWGIDGGGEWSTAAMMRYRSRRDLMEIAATPEFNGPHEFKIAAMKRTIAFPIQPLFQLGEPRVLLALILFGVAAGLHLLAGRRS